MPYDDYDDEMELVLEAERGGLPTFLLGVLVGAGVALLLAPRPGRETQRELARVLGGLRRGGVDGARASVADWVGSARGRATGRLDDARQAVHDGVGRVRGAVDEGRMAAQQARVQLRRRVDEAKDTYRSGRAGTAPVRRPAVVPAGDGQPQGGVVVTGRATERDPGDLAT